MGNSNIPPKEALREICLYGGNGDEEKVKEILKKNPHLLNEELNSHDSTILIYASIHNKIQIIKLLLSYDSININHQTNYGYTALHWACYYGRKDIVELLLSHSNIDINIKDEKGRLASDVCCDGYVANISIKPSILALLKSHSKTKAVLTPSPITTIKHSNEGSLSSNTVIPQTTLKESSIVEEVKDRELLTVVEEKESLKLQIEGLEETIREITNNNMNEMERRLLQEKENYMKEVDTMKKNRNEIVTMLQENNKLMVDQLLSEMKKALNNAERQIDEKEKRCQRLEDQVVRMEDRFEERMKSMENIINNLESRLCEKEKESVKLEDQMIRMEDKFEVRIKQMEVSQKETVRAMQLKPLPLPPNKQTHVFLTHTWREDEKGRNNHDRVGRVNEALRKRGLVTWFDSERMSGTVRQAMTDALDATCCVLIFITKKYEEKVNSKNEADNCYFEFNVAAHDTYLANMRIPIVMEECMLNEKGWQGRLKTEMGHQLYFDLSSDDKDVFEERCNEVFVRVVKLLNI